MNKQELIETVALDTGLSKRGAAEAVDTALSFIMTGCAFGARPVRLAGFGTFTTKHRAAKTGRNPRTGETVEIAAHTVVKFVQAGAFKDRVNGR